jgi:hypothetical protein
MASSAKQSKPLPKVSSSISFHIASSHCGGGGLGEGQRRHGILLTLP